MASIGSLTVSLLMATGQFETDTKRAESIAKKRAEAIDKAFSEMGRKIGLAATAAGRRPAGGAHRAVARAARPPFGGGGLLCRYGRIRRLTPRGASA